MRLKQYKARCHQLKPSDSVLGDDAGADGEAVQLIKGKKL